MGARETPPTRRISRCDEPGAPAGTPETTIQRLNTAFKNAAQVPSVVELLERNGYAIVSSSPEDFAAHIDAELERWGNTIETANITLE